MKKKVLVLYQDWGDWFTKDYEKFEFMFKKLDRAYDKNIDYSIIALGNHNKTIQKEKNIKVKLIKSSPIKQFLDLRKLRKEIEFEIKKFKPDLIYVPFLYLASALPKKRPKSIGFLRDITPEMIKAKGGLRSIAGQMFYQLDKSALKKLDIVLNNGKSLEHYAKKQGTKAKLIYNPRPISDIEFYDKAKPNKKLEELRKKKKKIILSIARLTKGKNMDLAIKALAHLPKNYILAIAGEGEELPNLKQLVLDLKLSDRVIFLGFIRHKDIWQYYKASDLFYLLSKTNFEGTPNVLQEAMHAKVPTIVSKIPAMRNIADNKNSLILKTYDEKELARKTKAILEDKKEYKKLQENGLKKVQEITKKSRPVREFFQ